MGYVASGGVGVATGYFGGGPEMVGGPQFTRQLVSQMGMMNAYYNNGWASSLLSGFFRSLGVNFLGGEGFNSWQSWIGMARTASNRS